MHENLNFDVIRDHDPVPAPDVAPTEFWDEWQDLVEAAAAAGRWSARQLAQRGSIPQLSWVGDVLVYIRPVDSPVASWLLRYAHGAVHEDSVVVRIALTDADLHPLPTARRITDSLLIRQAYAHAYSSVLAEEAGVDAEVDTPAAVPRQSTQTSPAGTETVPHSS